MGEGAQPNAHWPQPERRLTVQEAAAELGLSAEAVRSRIKRGTLESTKAGGTVYVLLEGGQTTAGRDQANAQTTNQTTGQALIAEHLDSLREEIAFLRAELERRGEEAERKDRIIAGLAQANAELARRVPEIEAPQSPSDARESASADREGESPGPEPGGREEPISRPWWRRLFGG